MGESLYLVYTRLKKTIRDYVENKKFTLIIPSINKSLYGMGQ